MEYQRDREDDGSVVKELEWLFVRGLVWLFVIELEWLFVIELV